MGRHCNFWLLQCKDSHFLVVDVVACVICFSNNPIQIQILSTFIYMSYRAGMQFYTVVPIQLCFHSPAQCILPPWACYCEGDDHDNWRTGL